MKTSSEMNRMERKGKWNSWNDKESKGFALIEAQWDKEKRSSRSA